MRTNSPLPPCRLATATGPARSTTASMQTGQIRRQPHDRFDCEAHRRHSPPAIQALMAEQSLHRHDLMGRSRTPTLPGTAPRLPAQSPAAGATAQAIRGSDPRVRSVQDRTKRGRKRPRQTHTQELESSWQQGVVVMVRLRVWGAPTNQERGFRFAPLQEIRRADKANWGRTVATLVPRPPVSTRILQRIRVASADRDWSVAAARSQARSRLLAISRTSHPTERCPRSDSLCGHEKGRSLRTAILFSPVFKRFPRR